LKHSQPVVEAFCIEASVVILINKGVTKLLKALKKFLSLSMLVVMVIAMLPAVTISAVEEEAELYNGIPVATGSGIDVIPAPEGPFFNIIDFGASSSANGVVNQKAIDDAILAAAAVGGGTVIIPAGDFKTYTIHLQSNVNIYFESKDSVIRAARAGTDGGYYDAPEPFLYVGIQDQGHSHYANSLFYAYKKHDIMITGNGLIDGTYTNASGNKVNALSRGDPPEVTVRTAAGNPQATGNGNKVFGLLDCQNIITSGFNVLYGGHFVFMCEGVVNWTCTDIIMDTDRDCVDIDCCENVTLRNLICNSNTDDAIVFKASFGVGRYMTCKNVLCEDCVVSGFDCGSVLAGAPSTDRVFSTGATGRVKFGTEATCGFDTVTVRNIHFEHSRGLAIESVDGADCKNIIVADCTMNDIMCSPIFVRIGDRSRAPVTGNSSSENVSAPAPNIRLDDAIFVLPNLIEKYGYFPIGRWIPSYSRSSVSINGTSISVINQNTPTRLNAGSIFPTDPEYANAVGPANIATVKDIYIGNIDIQDVDPRNPILLTGLVDSKIENLTLENINISYRGGLNMKHAVEQRNISTTWSYREWLANSATGSIQWLAMGNNEILLPRISWNPALNSGAGGWEDDPYNIPEATRDYPEPTNFGVLPAYGMYARHVNGLTVKNLTVGFMIEDSRPAFALDDVQNAVFENVKADIKPGVPEYVFITNTKKRSSNFEYVKDRPFITTTVSNVTVPSGAIVQNITVDRPSPATPPDTLYTYPTVPSTANPYVFDVPNASFTLPVSVHRPFFNPIPAQKLTAGQTYSLTVSGRNPATDRNPASGSLPSVLSFYAENLPAGAVFDPVTRTLTWTPSITQVGTHTIDFYLTDNVLPVKKTAEFTVAKGVPVFTDIAGNKLNALTADTFVTSLTYCSESDKDQVLSMYVAVYLPNGALKCVSIEEKSIPAFGVVDFKVVQNLPDNVNGEYAQLGYYASVFLWDDLYIPVTDKYMFK